MNPHRYSCGRSPASKLQVINSVLHSPRGQFQVHAVSNMVTSSPNRGAAEASTSAVVHSSPDQQGIDIRLTSPNVELGALPDYLKKDCLLFYFPETEPLARRIAQASSKIELGQIRWA